MRKDRTGISPSLSATLEPPKTFKKIPKGSLRHLGGLSTTFAFYITAVPGQNPIGPGAINTQIHDSFKHFHTPAQKCGESICGVQGESLMILKNRCKAASM